MNSADAMMDDIHCSDCKSNTEMGSTSSTTQLNPSQDNAPLESACGSSGDGGSDIRNAGDMEEDEERVFNVESFCDAENGYVIGTEGPLLFGGGVGCSKDYLQQKNPTPSAFDGTRFDKEPHEYYVAEEYGERLFHGSCTSFLRTFFPEKKPAEMLAGMDINKRRAEYPDMSDEQILAQWKDGGEKASAQGTLMHEEIELFMNNAWDPSSAEWRSEANHKSLQYFLDFHRKEIHGKIIPLWTELILSWPLYEFAGQIDFVGQRVECANDPARRNHIVVGDWKRSKKDFTEKAWGVGLGPCAELDDYSWSHFTLQTTLYALCLMENSNYIVDEIYVGVFHPNHDGYIWKQVTPRYDIARKMLNMRRQRQMAKYCRILLHRSLEISEFLSALVPLIPDPKVANAAIGADQVVDASRSLHGLVANMLALGASEAVIIDGLPAPKACKKRKLSADEADAEKES